MIALAPYRGAAVAAGEKDGARQFRAYLENELPSADIEALVREMTSAMLRRTVAGLQAEVAAQHQELVPSESILKHHKRPGRRPSVEVD